MAFPTNYTKYQEVTIDNTKVSADLTDFPVYVDLSDMDTTTDIFDTCRSDGGDIRVTKSDGTTQLAREVVSIDTTGKTGELHIKYTGTLSSSSDTVIRIWYNGTDTEPATSATYGRDAVWSDYVAVLHMNEDPSGTAPQMTDSTGNGNDGTSNGTMTSGDIVTGKVGKAIDLDGSDDYISISDPATAISGNWTVQGWAQLGSGASGNYAPLFSKNDSVGDDPGPFDTRTQNGTFPKNAQFLHSSASAFSNRIDGNNLFAQDTWVMVHHKFNTSNGAEGYTDGSSFGTNTNTSTNDFNEEIRIGSRGDGLGPADAIMDEFRLRTETLSGDWISTEYNNQNSPSTFYSTSDEQTSGGGGATRRIFHIT